MWELHCVKSLLVRLQLEQQLLLLRQQQHLLQRLHLHPRLLQLQPPQRPLHPRLLQQRHPQHLRRLFLLLHQARALRLASR